MARGASTRGFRSRHPRTTQFLLHIGRIYRRLVRILDFCQDTSTDIRKKWAHLDLNQGQLACKASALPLRYAPASTPVGATALSVPGTLPAVKTLATSPWLPGEGRCTGTG